MSKNCLFDLSDFKEKESNDFCAAPEISCNSNHFDDMIEVVTDVASAQFLPTTTSAVEFQKTMMFSVQGLDLLAPLPVDVPFFAQPGLVLWASAGTVFPSDLAMQVCFDLN